MGKSSTRIDFEIREFLSGRRDNVSTGAEWDAGFRQGSEESGSEISRYDRRTAFATLEQLRSQARTAKSEFVLGQVAGYEHRLGELKSPRPAEPWSGEVVVDTTAYRSAHGSEPRGRGQWTFVIGKKSYDLSGDPAIYRPLATAAGMTFAAAKKRAVAEARRRCARVVGVAP